MWQVFVIFALAAIITGISTSTMQQQVAIHRTASITATAQNIDDYATAVKNWAAANSGYSGTVSDTTIAKPNWIYHAANVSNYVSGGTAYIYYLPASDFPSGALAAALSAKGNVAGINATGAIYSGTTLLTTVPAAVPLNSVVLVL